MPVCLLADLAPDSFVLIDNYKIGGIFLCEIALFIGILWLLGGLSVTILEALKLKTYHEVRSFLDKILILAGVLFLAGFALWAFRTYGHRKEPKENPPVIRYHPPYDDSGIMILDD